MDTLRFAVAPAPEESGGGFQVLIFVNDVEMTQAGAGLGMDPYDVLIPVNRFFPSGVPEPFGVARCGCGVYGCGATNLTITDEGQEVIWSWSAEKPMDRPVRFARAAYLDEVERVGADHSWETPERTAGRLILTRADRGHLQSFGLTLSWVANGWRDAAVFQVSLTLDQSYQIFLRFPWNGDTPERLAARVLGTLKASPSEWSTTWHGMRQGHRDVPPNLAKADWAKEPV